MGNDLFGYIDRLESMAFFSAYPLVYSFVLFIVKERFNKSPVLMDRLVRILPLSYALTGVLFLGFLLKNMYPDFSLKNLGGAFQFSFLKLWGISAILFWLPFLNSRAVVSLLHSFVFFFFLLKDLFGYIFSTTDKNMISNDMKIYTDSLIITIIAYTVVLLIYFLSSKLSFPGKDQE